MEQLIILSIGVSEYQTLTLETCLPSAIFDSTLIANKFERRGFTKRLLQNPSKEQLMQSLADLKNDCFELHSMFSKTVMNSSSADVKTTYVIVYFVGYADADNNIILSKGDKVNLQKELAMFFFNFKNSHLFIFQDCMTEFDNYGEISCLSNSIKPTYVYAALFRSNERSRYLKNKNNAIITDKLMLGNIQAILASRTKVIQVNMIHEYISEKEFNSFLLKYFTACQNVCAAETRLMLIREF